MMGTTSQGLESGTDRHPIVATASASSAIRTGRVQVAGTPDQSASSEVRGLSIKAQAGDMY